MADCARNVAAVAVGMAAVVLVAPLGEAALSPDEKLFVNHCGTCHAKEAGAPKRQGPNLFGILGRKAGSEEGFAYSAGLKSAGWAWTAEKLDAWITDPKAMIPGTTMVYKQAKPETRAKIVAYLETLK